MKRLAALALGILLGISHARAADAPKPDARVPVASPTPIAYKPAKRPDGRRVVALDIGHTRAQPGAISATGVPEFEFNLRIVRLVKERLATSKLVEPVVINPEGNPITLTERSRRAALAGAALFVAVHHDSANDKYLQTQEVSGKKQFFSDKFEGYGVFVSKKNPDFNKSLVVARLVGAELEKNLPFATHHSEAIKGENRPILDSERGIYEYDDLIVLKSALMPAVLVECGVIVNREQDLLLRQPAMQEIIATAISTGIENYFALPASR
ncbi:MAG: N-acetylmuramoyl-L-alanine amidase [Chthoniobacteraceae bacterium]